MKSNIEWFRTFIAIYETGTLSEAAKALHISQPGVGLHLNALETFTGCPLFERTARRMIPTERARVLYQQVKHSITVLEDVEDKFHRSSGDRLTLSIGLCQETFQHGLEKHIPFTDFNLVIHFGGNENLMTLLQSGTADLIVTTEESVQPGLVFEPFTDENFVIVAGKETDTNCFDKMDQNDKEARQEWLRSQIWYDTQSDRDLLSRFWKLNFDARPDITPNYVLPNKFSILRCLSLGRGLALLPDFICDEAVKCGDVKVLWRGYHQLRNSLYFGVRRNTLMREQIEWVKKTLMKEFNVMPFYQ
jgi:LysR family transcriptional regulator, transcriptional activator of the cysJI operon